MPKASIILLVKNGEEFLPEILQSLQNQKVDFDFEIIAIDSGSCDHSLNILQSSPKVRLIQIPPETFNHGGTRNFGARNAHPDSEYIVFLTQDATPSNENWLANLIAPFSDDPQVAGVFSRHIPRPGASPSLVRQLTTSWQSGGTQRLVKKMPGSMDEFQRNRFYYNYFSDTSSALRRSIWQQIPFQPVSFAEDALWADAVIQAGFMIIFEPQSMVNHSHSYNSVEQFRQNVDYTNAVRQLFNPKEYASWLTWFRLFRGIPKNVWRDWIFLKHSPYFLTTPALKKIIWALNSPLWHISTATGSFIGANLSNIPPIFRALLSRQERLKKKR